MDIHNLSIKFFAKAAPAVSLDSFIPLFHNWIREKSVDGLLLDVADYKHVHQGPGMMLIGHECDYAIDMAQGKPGIMYRHKRDLDGDFASRMKLVLQRAIKAGQLLQDAGLIAFDTTAVEVILYDRLHAPNSPETMAHFQPLIHEALSTTLGADITSSALYSDSRSLFGLSIAAPNASELASLT